MKRKKIRLLVVLLIIVAGVVGLWWGFGHSVAESPGEILTSGFSKNEIENLKEQYATCGNQIRFGISSSTEDQDRIR